MASPKVLAVEGGSFSKAAGGRAVMAMLLTEGIVPKRLEFAWVEVDGLDATEALASRAAAFEQRLDIVLSDSVPIAGFNMIDARAIMGRVGAPVAFVLPGKPDADGVEAALKAHFPDWERRLEILAAAGQPAPHRLGDGEVYLECVGLDPRNALQVLQRLTVFGKVPEPIRLARMAAREASRLMGLTGM
jgi:endonuclease V-like protein UPF0215 family